MMDAMFEMVMKYGLGAVIAIFMIWNQRKDYNSVSDRLEVIEDYCRHGLMDLVKNTNEALVKSTDVIHENNKIIQENQEVIKENQEAIRFALTDRGKKNAQG